MRVSHFLTVCCMGFFGTFSLAAGNEAASHPLPPKHTQVGVTCYDCHQEETPSQKPVAEESCMACHGDFPAMAALTKGLTVNPHKIPPKPHPGPFTCTDCHRQHKPPVVKCLQCHPKFDLKAR